MIQKRSIVAYILLNGLTLGIYSLVMFTTIGKEIDRICHEDGESYMPFICAWLLGLITLGIYPVYWWYKQTKRLEDHVYRYRNVISLPHSAVTISSFWFFISYLGCIFAIDNINAFADVYGVMEPLPYTRNLKDRVALITGTSTSITPNRIPVSSSPNTIPGNNYRPPVTAKRPGITCIAGAYQGADFDIDNRGLVLGCDPTCSSIILEANGISGKHCSIAYDNASSQYIVADFSKTGTFIRGGQRILPDRPARLPRGTEIYLVNEQNIFRLN